MSDPTWGTQSESGGQRPPKVDESSGDDWNWDDVEWFDDHRPQGSESSVSEARAGGEPRTGLITAANDGGSQPSPFAAQSAADPASADRRILGPGSARHPGCRCPARRLRRRRWERRRADDTGDDRRADDNSADNDPPTDHYCVDCHDSRSDAPASRTSSRPGSAPGRPRGSSREPPEGIGGTQVRDGYPRRRLRCDHRGCRSRLPAVEQPATRRHRRFRHGPPSEHCPRREGRYRVKKQDARQLESRSSTRNAGRT